MNERILELMTKAGFDVEKLRMYPGGWPREDLLVLQDFAELIVRECINEIHVADVGDLKGKSYYLDKVAEHIEKHFGVEE